MDKEQKVIRKLRAILSADVKGYSLLMTNDELTTIKTLKKYRIIMSEIIKDHSGRVVDALGDNMLAEFSSAVEAVQCSMEIQNELKARNADLLEDKRLEFRIGVNVGDVVQDGDSLYGEGVNIAARIEGLADSGGICISRNAYDHIKNKMKIGCEYIGEHTVKNIKDPVRVYKVLMDPKSAEKRLKEESKPFTKKIQIKKWLRITAAIILILSALLAGIYWKYIYLPAPAGIDPDSKLEFNLPKGPSIAVLPFVNMSKDPEQEYFCDGITENIIATLAQTQLLLVIARNSTFAYKNKPINIQQIGQELNVEYVIEGSIQKSNDLIRIVIQLIDTDSGLHIWSERYDREFKDIFNLQDEITLEILKAVGIKLKGLGGDKSLFEGVTDISSFIKIVKVRHYYENPTKEGYASALKNAKEIIVSNPEYLHRYDLLAVVYLTGISLDPLQSSIKRLLLASEAVKKSLSLDENNYLAYQLLGWIFFNKKEFDKGITAYKKSLVLNPTSADAYSAIGFALNCNDNPSEALERMKIAFRLNPDPPAIYLDTLGWSYSGVGQHEKAIETYKTLLRRKPNYWSAYLMLTYSYISIGQEENAKTAVKKLLILVPDYSITKFKKFTFIKKNREVRLEGVAIALRKAGLPE